MKIIPNILASVFLVSCAVSTTPSTGDPLVGRWATDSMKSQLGRSKTTAIFRSDQTFKMSVILPFTTIDDEGTYKVSGDKIDFNGRSQRSMGYRFEDEHLILTEPGDTFKLHRTGTER